MKQQVEGYNTPTAQSYIVLFKCFMLWKTSFFIWQNHLPLSRLTVHCKPYYNIHVYPFHSVSFIRNSYITSLRHQQHSFASRGRASCLAASSEYNCAIVCVRVQQPLGCALLKYIVLCIIIIVIIYYNLQTPMPASIRSPTGPPNHGLPMKTKMLILHFAVSRFLWIVVACRKVNNDEELM